MGEPCGGVLRGDCGQGLGDSGLQRFQTSGLGRAQEMFDLGPGLLDGIEVRRVGRQLQQTSSRACHELAHARYLVGRQVIHDHHLPGTQPRTQDLLPIGQENISVAGLGNGHRSLQAAGGQRRQPSYRAPVTVGRGFPHPFATPRSAVIAGHLRGRAALVQKHQLVGSDRAYLGPPRLPPTLGFRRVLLLGVE